MSDGCSVGRLGEKKREEKEKQHQLILQLEGGRASDYVVWSFIRKKVAARPVSLGSLVIGVI